MIEKTLNINADALLEKFERGEVKVVHGEADGGEVKGKKRITLREACELARSVARETDERLVEERRAELEYVEVTADDVVAMADQFEAANTRIAELEGELQQVKSNAQHYERVLEKRENFYLELQDAKARIAELEAENAELTNEFKRVHRQADEKIRALGGKLLAAEARNQRLEILGAQLARELGAESMTKLQEASGRAVDIQTRVEAAEARLKEAEGKYAQLLACEKANVERNERVTRLWKQAEARAEAAETEAERAGRDFQVARDAFDKSEADARRLRNTLRDVRVLITDGQLKTACSVIGAALSVEAGEGVEG